MNDERWFVIASSLLLAVLFVASAYAGYAVGQDYPIEEELKKFFEYFGGFFDDPVLLALIIFANNAGNRCLPCLLASSLAFSLLRS